MRVYRWQWPDDFFVEISSSSFEKAMRILKLVFPERSLSSSDVEQLGEKKATYINWGLTSEEEEKDWDFAFHYCFECDFLYKVTGRTVDEEREEVCGIVSFDSPCPLCNGKGDGTIIRFIEDCPACESPWGVKVRRARENFFCSAVCEWCGNRISEGIPEMEGMDIDRMVGEWRLITTHTMIERVGEY